METTTRKQNMTDSLRMHSMATYIISWSPSCFGHVFMSGEKHQWYPENRQRMTERYFTYEDIGTWCNLSSLSGEILDVVLNVKYCKCSHSSPLASPKCGHPGGKWSCIKQNIYWTPAYHTNTPIGRVYFLSDLYVWYNTCWRTPLYSYSDSNQAQNIRIHHHGLNMCYL